MWTVNTKITEEIIDKFDSDNHIFYRFQDRSFAIEGDYEESWEMCYSSKEEAIAGYEDMDLDPEDAVLPGKSCMTTFKEIMDWVCQFDSKNYVLIAFEGNDTYATGHDDEYVATFYETAAIMDIDDAVNYYNN